ncbi:MAG: class I mannose-6-phosphate isomerase [Planctomycetota bacterium]|jgi:mannose-6-phosphate isomerase|nr:class I mannose-6-phosphate isomerase [Planctomycetota bacterium]
MLKLQPFISEKIWGYERWLVSDHPHGCASVELDTAGKIPAGASLASVTGGKYPLLIKVIQANETLSVQVHPDDDYAGKHENSRGKSEGWFVLQAAADASLVAGFNGKPDAATLRAAINENRLDGYLRSAAVRRGDWLYIPAGLVHAIGGGMRLLEIQESSDVTYRLYDWGRGRDVHIDRGLAVIKDLSSSPVAVAKFECPYFTWDIINGETFAGADGEVLFVLNGAGFLRGATGAEIPARAEDAFYCPAAEKISRRGDITVMRIRAR